MELADSTVLLTIIKLDGRKAFTVYNILNYLYFGRQLRRLDPSLHITSNLPGGPKKRYPGINFAITSANVHRFYPFLPLQQEMYDA